MTPSSASPTPTKYNYRNDLTPASAWPPFNEDECPPEIQQRPPDPGDWPDFPPEQRPYDPGEEMSKLSVGSGIYKDNSDIRGKVVEADPKIDWYKGVGSLSVCKLYPRGQVRTEPTCDGSRVFRLIALPCGSWDCARCGPELKRKWHMRLENTMTSAPYLEAVSMPMEKWDAFRKKMQRSGLQSYARLEQGDNTYLVAVPGEMGGEVISPGARKSFLVKALEKVPFTRRPISTSRDGWVPVFREPKKDKEWLTLDSTRQTSLEECKEAIDEFASHGVTSFYHTLTSGISDSLDILEFHIPAKMIKDGTYCRVLWSLGINSRRFGERRGERRKRDKVEAREGI